MSRQDQIEAIYEFFGGAPNTSKTYQSSVFPDIKCVCKYEPFEKMQANMPLLFITSPTSKEYRYAAQVKFIDYTLSCVLMWMTPGTEYDTDNRGAAIMGTFYGLLDEIVAKVRTNKQLITASYPSGAAIRFGEDISIQESHEVINKMMYIAATINISSREQVFA